ncbi:MAG: M48 family metallopeptidase, partial [Phycisphaerales bacterium]|nr:M48 family metallopeptidase [Phycisphaerales bacterium]
PATVPLASDAGAARAVRATQTVIDESRRTLRDEIKAYPGSITYLDLIRRNKRESVMLIVMMVLLAAVVGAVISAAVVPYFGGLRRVGDGFSAVYTVPQGSADEQMRTLEDRGRRAEASQFDRAPLRVLGADLSLASKLSVLAPSALLGAGVAVLLAGLGSVWSWFGGSKAILAMSGAIPLAPETDRELFNVVDEVRIAANVPMPAVYIMNDSAMNAFATGRDPGHAAVAITRGLREKLTRDELQGVIAHEVAHIRHYDIRFAMLMATMVGLIVFACDAFLRIAWHGGRHGAGRVAGRSDKNKGGGLAVILMVIALVLAILAPLIARLIQMAYSRQREYLADAGAVELTRNPEGLAAALAKLADDPEPLVETANRGTAHLYIVNPLKKMRDSHQALDTALSSHPPAKKRIARLLALTR